MTSTPTPEPAKITCPDCGGHPSEPKLRTEGGSLSCSFCNRTLTFNFMRDNEPEHRACACRASRNARCQTCGGDGEIDVRPAPSTPGEGTGRPVPLGIEQTVATLMVVGNELLAEGRIDQASAAFVAAGYIDADAKSHAAQPPASPVPPTRPGADAVIRALIAACPSYGRGEGDTFRIEESAVVRLAREFLAAAPPTPTPCPYIVTGGEGTSHCSLAERSAMHAAAPPSTPADPRPTDPTGSEA
jgi:hypothetical protein